MAPHIVSWRQKSGITLLVSAIHVGRSIAQEETGIHVGRCHVRGCSGFHEWHHIGKCAFIILGMRVRRQWACENEEFCAAKTPKDALYAKLEAVTIRSSRCRPILTETVAHHMTERTPDGPTVLVPNSEGMSIRCPVQADDASCDVWKRK